MKWGSLGGACSDNHVIFAIQSYNWHTAKISFHYIGQEVLIGDLHDIPGTRISRAQHVSGPITRAVSHR